ncbi:MAG: hypothetical protein A3G41_02820 [Elusimicrobia bacterium RIFCSPLOWO2_12_FULL_59_9]|nr:MAG: hypothetical protein A3G41_02820 [Elusimicrobia bacterium RIFCSPLOWO2_12_FULL_59_9]
MRSFSNKVPGFFLALLFVLRLAGPAFSEDAQIVVYHTNDIHGWIMPHGTGKKREGGFAVLSAVLQRETSPYLLLDAGDWFQGTPEGSLSRGEAVMDCMNALAYSAAAVGNHEFDFGQAALMRLARQAKFPVLGANVYELETGRPPDYLTPRIIREVSGIRVGIFGLVTRETPGLSFPRNVAGLDFRREIETARAQAAELRKAGAAVVIALTHMGFPKDLSKAQDFDDAGLAARVEGIDLIVGGHSHTLLPEGFVEPTHGTRIVQAGHALTHAGRAVLTVSRETQRVVRSESRLLALRTESWGEDPAMGALAARWREKAAARMDEKLGRAEADLKRGRGADSALGNWSADCMRRRAQSDVAFINSGGLRSDLSRGVLTRRDIFQVMPFDNSLMTLRLSGLQIRRALSHALRRSPGFLQISGLAMEYGQGRSGQKTLGRVWIGGKLVDLNGIYLAVLPDYLVEGGDGFGVFRDGLEPRKLEIWVRDALSQCVLDQKTVRVPQGRRIRKIEKE